MLVISSEGKTAASLLACLLACLLASQPGFVVRLLLTCKQGGREKEGGWKFYKLLGQPVFCSSVCVCVEASGAESALVEKKRPLPLPGRHWRWHDDGLVYAHDRKIIINIEQKGGGRPKASVVMQRLSYSTDTVLSNNITRDRIVKTVLENHYDGDVYRGQVTAGPSASLDSLRAFVA